MFILLGGGEGGGSKVSLLLGVIYGFWVLGSEPDARGSRNAFVSLPVRFSVRARQPVCQTKSAN